MSFEKPSTENTGEAEQESKEYSIDQLNMMKETVKSNIDSIRMGVENGLMEQMQGQGRGLGGSPIESGASYKVFASGFGSFEARMDVTPWRNPSEKTKVNKITIERSTSNFIKEPKPGDVMGTIERINIDGAGDASYAKVELVAIQEKDKYEERTVEVANLSSNRESVEDPEKVLEQLAGYKQIAMLRPKVEKLEKTGN